MARALRRAAGPIRLIALAAACAGCSGDSAPPAPAPQQPPTPTPAPAPQPQPPPPQDGTAPGAEPAAGGRADEAPSPPRTTPGRARSRPVRPIDITLKSEPHGALAEVDGRPIGTTPALWAGESDGQAHEFTFSLAGFAKAHYRFVPVTSGVLHATLQPLAEQPQSGLEPLIAPKLAPGASAAPQPQPQPQPSSSSEPPPAVPPSSAPPAPAAPPSASAPVAPSSAVTPPPPIVTPPAGAPSTSPAPATMAPAPPARAP